MRIFFFFQAEAGIRDGVASGGLGYVYRDRYLIRLSLGVENYEDIERDIIQALDKAQIGEIV
ncbi:hypothetical protein G6X36_00190 [Staphylococcus aureus]|nr:hypothetical protein [Staphylococcus aureus]